MHPIIHQEYKIGDTKSTIFGLKLAKIASKKSNLHIKIGAAIVDGNHFVAAWNKKKTSVASRREGYKWENQGHAELMLVNHSTKKLSKLYGTVYVYRELANGEPALARPCKFCMAFLKRKGIRRIVYTTYLNDGGFKTEEIGD